MRWSSARLYEKEVSMAYHFGLMFRSVPPFGDDGPTVEQTEVYIKESSIGGYPGYEHTTFITSGDAANVEGFEEQIDRLQAELDEIRKEGRRKFAEAERKNAERRAARQDGSNY